MARSNTNEKDVVGNSKSNATAKNKEKTSGLTVTTEEYTRTRDSVITGLTTLQSTIGDLIHAYLAHTNTVLGGIPSAFTDTLAISNPLGFSSNAGGSGGAGAAAVTATGGIVGADGGKKKRTRKERDPNAPKRPLTAYFLYAQRAREYIRKDLAVDDAEVKPGEISSESTRRWHAMKPEEQEKWKNLYRQYWQEYLREEKEYRAKFGSDPGADGDEDNENAEDSVPPTEEEAVTEAMLREQFRRPSSASPAKGNAGAASSSKSKAKQQGIKEKDAGENGVSVPRLGTAGKISGSSPAPRRVPTKETPIPIPRTDDVHAAGATSDVSALGKLTGTSDKRKKKSSGNMAADAKTATSTADQGQDRETVDEPKRKRARKSKGGADESAANNAVEKERDDSKVNEVDQPASTQDSAGGGSSRKRGKRKSEGGK